MSELKSKIGTKTINEIDTNYRKIYELIQKNGTGKEFENETKTEMIGRLWNLIKTFA